jgi:3-hydroxyacyl-[acyl-carrier-protein] dehydratase
MEKAVLERIPHAEPFRFVDVFHAVSAESASGSYVYREDAEFYRGHFPKKPITPGVILVETMVQIGLLGIGIAHCLQDKSTADYSQVVLSAADVSFHSPVYPGERVTVMADKVYLRFGKLKCRARMVNQKGKTVCKGDLSGMLVTDKTIKS